MSCPIKVAILGSTGSIGTQTLQIASAFSEKIKVVALSAGKNIDKLLWQMETFKPELVSVATYEDSKKLKELISKTDNNCHLRILYGEEGLKEVATIESATIVVSAISGAAGLLPTWEALTAGKRVALANKESLVMTGALIMPRYENQIFPVDSEHCAIFQSLGCSFNAQKLRRIILTASGGPFFGWDREKLAKVKVEDALNNPNWKMGPKITVDSATLLNKGLEIIEACHLFGLSQDKIDVLVHRESIIHSMVEYHDGSIIAQMGRPDMLLPIAFSLSFPERLPLLENNKLTESLNQKPYDFIKPLTFYAPDRETFKLLSLAGEALKEGGSAPIVLNASSELSVGAFLEGKIKFLDIQDFVELCLNKFEFQRVTSVKEALDIDASTRKKAEPFLSEFYF